MAEDAAPLEYAPAKRRRRQWPLVVGFVLVALLAFLFAGRRVVSAMQWVSDLSDRRTVLRGAAASGTLDLTSAVAGKGVGPFLNEFASRARAWSAGTGATATKLSNLTRPRPTAGPGNPAVTFIGELVAADGTERFAVVGLNVGVKNDGSEAYVDVDVELFNIGTWRNPAFSMTNARAAAVGSTIRFSEHHHWASFALMKYRPGDAITFDAPNVAADDPATLRLPFKIDGVEGAFRFTLGSGDIVTVSREGKLPAIQPTTRSAA